MASPRSPAEASSRACARRRFERRSAFGWLSDESQKFFRRRFGGVIDSSLGPSAIESEGGESALGASDFGRRQLGVVDSLLGVVSSLRDVGIAVEIVSVGLSVEGVSDDGGVDSERDRAQQDSSREPCSSFHGSTRAFGALI